MLFTPFERTHEAPDPQALQRGSKDARALLHDNPEQLAHPEDVMYKATTEYARQMSRQGIHCDMAFWEPAYIAGFTESAHELVKCGDAMKALDKKQKADRSAA